MSVILLEALGIFYIELVHRMEDDEPYTIPPGTEDLFMQMKAV